MLPSFDEKALSALTEKIEKDFGKSQAPQQLGDTGSRNRKKEKQGNEQRHFESNPRTSKGEHTRGTKRDAQGNVKAGGKANVGSNSRPTKNKSGDANGNRDVLLKEILALGGTEEDLDLVAEAPSSDEDLEGNYAPAEDKSFKKDLANFVAGLGIEGAGVEDASEAEVEEEDAGEEQWEKASDLASPDESLSDDAEETPKKAIPALPELKNLDASKGPNRLVSSHLHEHLF